MYFCMAVCHWMQTEDWVDIVCGSLLCSSVSPCKADPLKRGLFQGETDFVPGNKIV